MNELRNYWCEIKLGLKRLRIPLIDELALQYFFYGESCEAVLETQKGKNVLVCYGYF